MRNVWVVNKGLWTSHFLKPGEVWNKMKRPGRVNFCQPKGICRPHQGKCHQMFSIWVFLACELALEMIPNAAYCCIMLIGLFYILHAKSSLSKCCPQFLFAMSTVEDRQPVKSGVVIRTCHHMGDPEPKKLCSAGHFPWEIVPTALLQPGPNNKLPILLDYTCITSEPCPSGPLWVRLWESEVICFSVSMISREELAAKKQQATTSVRLHWRDIKGTIGRTLKRLPDLWTLYYLIFAYAFIAHI